MRYSNRGAFLLLLLFCTTAHATEFSVFGSTIFARGDNKHEQNFVLGDLELIAEQNISESSYVSINVLFESDNHSHFEVDVEQFAIHKSLTDNIEFTLGRFLEPLGLWNFDFSHGSLAQHTVNRPYIFELEHDDKAIMPSHLIGTLFTYDADFFTVQLSAANSNGMDTSDADAKVKTLSSTPNKDITTLLRVAMHPSPQFQFSLLALQNNVAEIGMMGTDVDHGDVLFEQSIFGADFRYRSTRFYIFGEFYNIEISDNPGISGYNPDTYVATTSYVQIGFNLSTQLTFVARHERLDIDDNATYFTKQQIVSLKQNTVGLNYKFDESNALRFEAKRLEPEMRDTQTNYYLQWYFYLL